MTKKTAVEQLIEELNKLSPQNQDKALAFLAGMAYASTN